MGRRISLVILQKGCKRQPMIDTAEKMVEIMVEIHYNIDRHFVSEVSLTMIIKWFENIWYDLSFKEGNADGIYKTFGH